MPNRINSKSRVLVNFPGGNATSNCGFTPVSTDPAVDTLFATESENYGQGIIYIATKRDLAGVIIEEGNFLSVTEKEVGIKLLPEQYAKMASVSISAAESRSIFNEMGIHIPTGIYDKLQLSTLLEELPKLTSEQIRQFFLKVLEMKGMI